jgi:hypothetical protein
MKIKNWPLSWLKRNNFFMVLLSEICILCMLMPV